MIDALFNSQNYQVARQMLDASVLRQQALASNIANAETPGYKRVDVPTDFASQLKAALERGGTSEVSKVQAQIAEDLTAKAVRPDGNNVEIEKELMLLGQNSTEFGFLSQVVSTDIRNLRVAITGRTS